MVEKLYERSCSRLSTVKTLSRFSRMLIEPSSDAHGCGLYLT